MRTRKEIESEEIAHTHTTDGRDGEVTYGNPVERDQLVYARLTLEVLLDIRELLLLQGQP